MGVDVAHETAAKAFHEFDSCIMGIDVKVYIVPHRGDISCNQCLAVYTICSQCVNIYLFLGIIVFCMCVQCTHSSVLKFKIFYSEVSIYIGFITGYTFNICSTGCKAVKFYRMEIYHIKNIVYVYILEIYLNGI